MRLAFKSSVLRVIVAILAAALGSFVFAGLLTFFRLRTHGAFLAWLSVVLQLIGFLAATIIANRIAPRRALLAVAVGIGGTWGLLAVAFFPRPSAVIVLGYVVASLALAFVLDRRRTKGEAP
jgi:hypothetical protein